MEIKNKNRNHEATKDCDKASRGNGLPSARLGWSVSGNIERERHRGESERSRPDTETLRGNAHQHLSGQNS